MDPKSNAPMMMAPGSSSSSSLRLPGGSGYSGSPEDHLVEPETREEMIRGRRIQAMPANPPHADRNAQIDFVIWAHAAPGYVVATDLLTRVAVQSDFASDTCIRRAGIDPSTGARYLEELVFEVCNTQSLKDITEKAEDLAARGVRRIFAVFVKTDEVKEWRGGWVTVAGEISDPCLCQPLLVAALVRGAAADGAAVAALKARQVPELRALEEFARQEGERQGRQDGERQGRQDGERQGRQDGERQEAGAALVDLCEVLGIELTAPRRARLERASLEDLRALRLALKQARRWPE